MKMLEKNNTAFQDKFWFGLLLACLDRRNMRSEERIMIELRTISTCANNLYLEPLNCLRTIKISPAGARENELV